MDKALMDNDNTENKSLEAPVSKKEHIISEIKSITLILLAVLIFRSCFFEPFRIPSGSMIPTLYIGDFILVNKFSYGFKLPFTGMTFWQFGNKKEYLIDNKHTYLFGQSDPERGDVIVFRYPNEKSTDYIKRVIGVPGDKIQIVENRRVFVNGKELEASPLKEKFEVGVGRHSKDDYDFYESKTGDHSHYLLQKIDGNFQFPDRVEITVPKGKFFVMGDNRDNSSDSRVWGFVPRDNIKGKALFVWFNMTFPGSEFGFSARPSRIGTAIP